MRGGAGGRRRGSSLTPGQRGYPRDMSMMFDRSEGLNIAISTLYALMSLFALKFPFETEETPVYTHIRGVGLIIFIVLIGIVHTIKVKRDQREDWATWFYYRSLTFDLRGPFYWKGLSHFFGYVLLVVVGITSGVNLHFTKNSYALGVVGIIGGWVNSVLNAWPKTEDLYFIERIGNSAQGMLKKMKRFYGYATAGRMKIYEVDAEYRYAKVDLIKTAV